MDKELLKHILLEQHQIHNPIDTISRELKTRIHRYEKTPFILIISGIRRSGKSTLLHQIRSDLDNGFYVNFDDERFIDFSIQDFHLLHELLIELFGDRDIFFFDEIQNIRGWERFVRRLQDSGKKIYVTGSNASMLSKELGTHLTGRHISFPLYPFSFKEFLKFKQQPYGSLDRLTTREKSILKRYFNEYITKGGFPEYLQTEKKEYLESLYENIIYRDIITRYKLPNEKPLLETAYYASSNLGKEISFNSIRKLTGLSSATTIHDYFKYLENSYLLFLVPKYSPSLKKQIYQAKKVYIIDTGLANIIGFRPSTDQGRMLENIVFLQLKRNDHEIYYHKDKHECDFIIRDGMRISQAIQVTTILHETSRQREIQGLLEALEHYKLKEGLILTTDQEELVQIDQKKILIKPIWKWLLEDSRSQKEHE